MFKFKKLILASIAALVLLFNLSVPFAKAQANPWYQGPWYLQGPVQWYSKVYDSSNPQEIFGERYTAAQVQWVIYSLFSVGINTFISPDVVICISTFDVFGSCTTAGQDTIKRFMSNPFFLVDANGQSNLAETDPNQSLLSKLVADRPLSGITYVKHLGTSFHIVPETYAQTGFGYNAFTFVQGLWGATRNITYGLMILVIIGMAFMIMFRTKISPQAVITVQSALPKIVITLILITFSYAIAGFLVDIMYVAIALVSLIFSSSGIFDPSVASATTLFDQLTNGNLGLGAFGILVLYWFRFMLGFIAIISNPDLSSIGSGITSVLSIPVGISLMPIIILIVSLLLLWISFKVLWMLIKTFINIILLVIAAPFIIALGALRSGSGFGGWVRSLASNLAVYPVAGVLFFVSFIFLGAAYNAGGVSILPGSWSNFVSPTLFGISRTAFTGPNSWAPPLTLGPSNGAGMRFLWLFASLGVLAIAPKTVELIQSMMTGKPFAYGSAIGEVITPVAYGELQRRSSAQATKYKTALDAVKGNVNALSPGTRASQTVWNLVGSFSGGKIKR